VETHRLGTLSWLELTFPYGHESPGCDITFIEKLPRLRKFSCAFEHGPSVLKMGPIDRPMLEMKEFRVVSVPHFVYGVDIDAESMWTIFHRMPNLEELTLHDEIARVTTLMLYFLIGFSTKRFFFRPAKSAV
jgi:hypothetical protein